MASTLAPAQQGTGATVSPVACRLRWRHASVPVGSTGLTRCLCTVLRPCRPHPPSGHRARGRFVARMEREADAAQLLAGQAALRVAV